MRFESYAGHGDLFDRVSRDDLAERAAPDDHDVTGDALRAYVAGTYSGAELHALRKPGSEISEDDFEAACARAAERVAAALADASARVRGYLAARYPALAPPTLDSSAADGGAIRSGADGLLLGLTADVFLAAFFGGDEYLERNRLALRYLQSVAEGRVDLSAAAAADGDGEADAGGAANLAAAAAPAERFGETSLSGYLEGV